MQFEVFVKFLRFHFFAFPELVVVIQLQKKNIFQVNYQLKPFLSINCRMKFLLFFVYLGAQI